MDGDRFDGIARRMADRASRRRALKLLAGGVAGGLAGVVGRRARVEAQQTVSCFFDPECRQHASENIGPCATGFCQGADPFFGIRGQCQFVPGNAGFFCRPSAGPCDLPESCTGSSMECPPDQFRPSTHVCRAAVGECDVPEFCTGDSPQCPADAKAPAGTPCGTDTNVCNGQEVCNGAGACVAGTPLICPEDDNPCTIAACDPDDGCGFAPVADNTPCDGTGGCVAGQCVTCGNNEEFCNGRCRRKSSYNGDDRNCGACGHACPDSHVCKGGFCRPLR